jgi:predicted nucleotidyltransferase
MLPEFAPLRTRKRDIEYLKSLSLVCSVTLRAGGGKPFTAIIKDMAKKHPNSSPRVSTRVYWGADVPMRVIRRFARAVAQKFHPEKIILFGSHAYGTPHEDSDVDILVVMPARNQLDQAYKIRLAVPAPFPMDLIVRTPKNMNWRLKEGESFLTQIMSMGKVLYEKTMREWSRIGDSANCLPND